jgi:hypothetical protein
MQTRRIAAVLVALSLMIAVPVWLSAVRPAARPLISIGVLSSRWGKPPSFSVRVGITNTGSTTIRYNQMNFDANAWVRTKSRSGWATRDIGPLTGLPWMPALLRPGSNTYAIILLPPDTVRWQVGYRIRTASLRDRVTSRIPGKRLSRLRPLCERFLSSREGPEQQIRSGLFHLFDSDAFWPVATEAEHWAVPQDL